MDGQWRALNNGLRWMIQIPAAMFHPKHAALVCASLCARLLSTAQDGSIDPTFNASDIGYGNGDGASNQLQATAIQPDGKILIAGPFGAYNGTARNSVARLNT